MAEPQQLGHMLYIQQLITELERLSRMDDNLSDGLKFIQILRAGIEHSLEHGQPLVGALWLQDKPSPNQRRVTWSTGRLLSRS